MDQACLHSRRRHQIKRVPLIPSVMLQVLNLAKDRKVDLSSLMWVGRSVHSFHWFNSSTESTCSGAAYLPEEVRSAFAKQLNPNAFVTQGWGMSECVRTCIHIRLKVSPS
jgi:acyl-CoA synthetase (AMP-forming)/AMP-acid ligase II